jgi:riboflavin-specific deaminase-like protein
MSYGSAAESAWSLVLAAAAMTESLERQAAPRWFVDAGAGTLTPADAAADDVVLSWQPDRGWQRLGGCRDDAASALLDLYLPVCSATLARPVVIGHLGQSLDGFIATPSGESRYVTGPANMVHMHRLRALCDAVIVGAGTVAHDDPQLTTRLVPGGSPLRVVYDPDGRLDPHARVFADGAPTIHARARTAAPPAAAAGGAEVLALEGATDAVRLSDLLRTLSGRGCARVFVEGGGVTVSTLVQASLLDRLHIAVAPVLIGDGRAGIRLAPPARLGDCRRPACRVFRMGADLLFDCDLRALQPPEAPSDLITRVY